MRRINVVLGFAMFLLVSHLQGRLEAYLDPNTGSMALQMLLAGVVAVLATLRMYRNRIRSFFVRRQARPGTPSSDASGGATGARGESA
jgi:hypothetical protein